MGPRRLRRAGGRRASAHRRHPTVDRPEVSEELLDRIAVIPPSTAPRSARSCSTGSPPASVPALEVEGAPVGVSFVGAPGSDHALLDLAGRVGPVLGGN